MDDNFPPPPSVESSTVSRGYFVGGQTPLVSARDGPVTLVCLFTKHKTQKRKVYKDGFLKVNVRQNSISLHEKLNKAAVETLESLSRDELCAIASVKETDVEFENYLVTVESLYVPETVEDMKRKQDEIASRLSTSTKLLPRKRPIGAIGSASSQGIQGNTKLFSRKKFNVPSAIKPKPLSERLAESRKTNRLANRNRPLQPGELDNFYYANQQQQVAEH